MKKKKTRPSAVVNPSYALQGCRLRTFRILKDTPEGNEAHEEPRSRGARWTRSGKQSLPAQYGRSFRPTWFREKKELSLAHAELIEALERTSLGFGRFGGGLPNYYQNFPAVRGSSLGAVSNLNVRQKKTTNSHNFTRPESGRPLEPAVFAAPVGLCCVRGHFALGVFGCRL